MTVLTPRLATSCAVLVGRGLVMHYRQRKVLAGVDLAIRAGSVLALLGPTGSGKTTLLNVMAGIVPPDEGEVMLDGRRIDLLDAAERSELRRREFGVVFQHTRLIDELSAEQNVALPLLMMGAGRARAFTQARWWLAHLGLADAETRVPRELSSSQVRRVALARALVHRPRVILADGPTIGLDGGSAEAVTGALFGAAEDGAAVVIVTQDRALAARTQRQLYLREGAISGGVLMG